MVLVAGCMGRVMGVLTGRVAYFDIPNYYLPKQTTPPPLTIQVFHSTFASFE